jgi:Cu+-exporting ATPase
MVHQGAFRYFCPMHTQVRQMAAGSCSICGMALEPNIEESDDRSEKLSNRLKQRLILALALSLPIALVQFFPHLGMARYAPWIELFFAGFVLIGPGAILLKQGWSTVRLAKIHLFSLASLGILLAYLFSAYKVVSDQLFPANEVVGHLSGYFFEPTVWIIDLLLAGLYAHSLVEEKILDEVEQLRGQMPATAHLILERGEERKIAIDDLKRGDLIRVNPNENVPADGLITEGQSWLNEMMITGENLPVYKRSRDRVLAGSVNGNSPFVFVVERVADDTLLSQVIQVIARAQMSKAPLQESIDRFLAFFIPGVILFALLSGMLLSLWGEPLSMAIGRMVSILIVASPAAFAVALPMAMVVGFGVAARHGILVREASALEKMHLVDTLVVDKTGVLTEGKPLLTKIFAQYPFSETEVLRWGASVESCCDHPLGQAVVSGAALKQVPLMKASHVQTIEGKGVIARIDGSRVAVGNIKLLEDLGVDPAKLKDEAEDWQKEGLTVSYVVMEDRVAGLIAISDTLRYTSERTVQELHREGLSVVMATGDSKEAAQAVAKRLKLDRVEAEMLTQDKMALVQRLQAENREVAMAGDGVIDAPALAQADVGIALNTAIDFEGHRSSILILKGDLRGVVRIRNLSQQIMGSVKQTLKILAFYNIVMIPLASGLLHSVIPLEISPFAAAVTLSLINLFAVGNALRIRKVVLYQD